jgi:hypothetical protein
MSRQQCRDRFPPDTDYSDIDDGPVCPRLTVRADNPGPVR